MPPPPSPPTASPAPPGPNIQPSPPATASAAASAAGPSDGAAQPPAPAPAPGLPIAETYGAVRASVRARQLARFQACHRNFRPSASAAPGAAPQPEKKKLNTLLRSWILPHRCSIEQPIVVQVLLLDSTLDDVDGVVFDVLGWEQRDVVLGATLRGGTHLRVVPRRQMPDETMKELRKLASANAEVQAESYEASSFVEAAFDRGEPRGLEDVALITGGPFKAMACNLVRPSLLVPSNQRPRPSYAQRLALGQEMKAVLMEQLSWGLEPNGKKSGKMKRVFTLAAMDIKASANLLGHDVASRHRLDIRGKPSAIAMRQVIELMRGPSTKLPYWRSGTKHGGTVAVLRELEGWLGGMAVDARAGKQPFPARADRRVDPTPLPY